MDEVASNFRDGITAIKSAIKELEQAGYLSRKRMFDPATGRITGYQWTLHSKPSSEQETQQAENPTAGQSSGRETQLHSNTDDSNKEPSNNKKLEPVHWDEDAAEIDRKLKPYPLRDRAAFFVAAWNGINGAQTKLTADKLQDVSKKLRSYKPSEILRAIRNRKADKWVQEAGIVRQWNRFWKHGDKVDDYLNKEVKSKPRYGVNMPMEYYQ